MTEGKIENAFEDCLQSALLQTEKWTGSALPKLKYLSILHVSVSVGSKVLFIPGKSYHRLPYLGSQSILLLTR